MENLNTTSQDPNELPPSGQWECTDAEPTSSPTESSSHPDRMYLDSAERLSLRIIGELAMRGHLTRLVINNDDTGLAWLYQDITSAIKTAMPDLDKVEITRLMESKSAE
jgi:hypothetical protein